MVISAIRLAPASMTVHTKYSGIELLQFCKIDAAAAWLGIAAAARLIAAAARTIFPEVCMLGSYFRRASLVTIAGGCDQIAPVTGCSVALLRGRDPPAAARRH